jgi:hypothetical protein
MGMTGNGQGVTIVPCEIPSGMESWRCGACNTSLIRGGVEIPWGVRCWRCAFWAMTEAHAGLAAQLAAVVEAVAMRDAVLTTLNAAVAERDAIPRKAGTHGQ